MRNASREIENSLRGRSDRNHSISIDRTERRVFRPMYGTPRAESLGYMIYLHFASPPIDTLLYIHLD